MHILYLKCIVRSTGPQIHFPFLNSKINSNYKHNDITSLSFWQFNYLTCKATHFTSRISLTVVFGRNLRMVVVLPGFLSLWYRLPEEKMKYSSILNSNIFQSKKSFTIMQSLLADSFSNWFQFLKIIKKIVFHEKVFYQYFSYKRHHSSKSKTLCKSNDSLLYNAVERRTEKQANH